MKASKSGKNIYVGTSGYYFDDWIGAAYPPNTKKSGMLEEYLKLGFDALELNFTFYKIADAKQLAGFSSKAQDDFAFIIKAYKKATHEKADKSLLDTLTDNYHAGNTNGNFRGILLQFPESFRKTKENTDYLLFIRERMKDLNLFVEFRRNDWMNNETFKFLRENNLLYAAADLPQIGNLPKKTIETTGDSSYLRLHGRNKEWYSAADRYDYLYSMVEIDEFNCDVIKLMNKTVNSFVFFNNCHGGFAVKNALMLKEAVLKGGQ
ncbi:MAG: DUF72 domain-containing protein [bacterium]